MNLFSATFLTGAVSLAFGLLFLFSGARGRERIRCFPRSMPAAVICFGGGALWFLYHVANLGEADFGNIRYWLLLLFGGVALMGFFVANEFLAVRGVAVLMLLAANDLLAAAYMQEPLSRLWLVGYVYLGILAALYIGAVPYRIRDLLDWLFSRRCRQHAFGGLFAAYGLFLLGVALTY